MEMEMRDRLEYLGWHGLIITSVGDNDGGETWREIDQQTCSKGDRFGGKMLWKRKIYWNL